jgi:hypothetical protein
LESRGERERDLKRSEEVDESEGEIGKRKSDVKLGEREGI